MRVRLAVDPEFDGVNVKEEYTCRNTAYATVQIDQRGGYFVWVAADFSSRNNPPRGDYSVEISESRDAAISRLQSVSNGLSDTTMKVSATISNPRNTQVHLQYKKSTDASLTSAAPQTSQLDDSLTFTITGLQANTAYNVRASLESECTRRGRDTGTSAGRGAGTPRRTG